MNINKTITFVIYASLLSAQFKPGFIKAPKEEIDIEAEGFYDKDQDEKFKHKQMLSMSLSLKRAVLFQYTHIAIFSVTKFERTLLLI